MSTATLYRLSALSVVLGGMLFAGVQIVHPPEVLSAVTTSSWVAVHYTGFVMCLAILTGITGIFLRQAHQAGWIGFAGYVSLVLMWSVTAAFQFIEATMVPALAGGAPAFVESWLGITSSTPGTVNLGPLPTIYAVNSLFYLAGGLLFGIATVRAGVLSRGAGALLAAGTVATLGFALLPHEFVRFAAAPVALALVWLGISLWVDQRVPAATAAASRTIATTAGEA